jgi:short subunit dehydrogenase-like uncharacterized protein
MSWMIYGANGYTGQLVAREAVRRGLRPILAGRDELAVKTLARELGLPSRAFSLGDPDEAEAALLAAPGKVEAVVHCAGPFLVTSAPMVAACLATRTHYLDITGELVVFERILALGRQAGEAGVALLPGVGFDVVPSDCLAAQLGETLIDASELTLAFTADGGSWSRGTLKTMLESLPGAGAVRRDGRIVPVPIAHEVRQIEFGCGPRWAMTIPWGDVSTAYHTTGIPNVRVFSGAPPKAIRRLRQLSRLLPLAGLKPVKRLLQRAVDLMVTGPTEEARDSGRVYLWGEVKNAAGATVTATLETPEAYHLTAVTAVTCVERVLEGKVEPGSWTPARAFGSRFILEIPGVTTGEIRRSE